MFSARYRHVQGIASHTPMLLAWLRMTDNARRSDAYDQTLMSATQGSWPTPRNTASDDALIGAELANTYRIDKVLGEGGMGRLYEAEHVRVDRRFAVKVVHHPLAQREDIRARFDREARVMSRIRSDHVVDVVDVVRAPDGRTCIVTELLQGVDLEQHLAQSNGKVSVAEAVVLVRQCLRGLSAAHAHKVVHRDLKPSNLFVAKDTTGNLSVKILDFGVAKIAGDAEMTSTGVIVGTPAYMAPEQARSSTSADARSDLYAVGAVLYRMLTGQSPYGGADANGTLIRLMEEAPERPSLIERTIPAGLEAVIEKAMARDPMERYQTADELDRALSAFDQSGRSVLSAQISGADVPLADDARTLGRRAKLVRPLAVLIALLTAFSAAVGVGAALALVVASLSNSITMGTSETVLVSIVAGVAFVASGIAMARGLSSAFRNAAMVQALSSRWLRALGAGFVVLGAEELSASLWAAFILQQPGAHDPKLAALRLVIALGVGTYAALSRRR